MHPHNKGGLMPPDEARDMIRDLEQLISRLHDAYKQSKLPYGGRLPDSASFVTLISHAAFAQYLSRDVTQLTSDFALSPYCANEAESTLLTRLSTASSMASLAATSFTEAAEIFQALPRSQGDLDRQELVRRLETEHHSARLYLDGASRSLRDTAKELDPATPRPRRASPTARSAPSLPTTPTKGTRPTR